MINQYYFPLFFHKIIKSIYFNGRNKSFVHVMVLPNSTQGQLITFQLCIFKLKVGFEWLMPFLSLKKRLLSYEKAIYFTQAAKKILSLTHFFLWNFIYFCFRK